MLRNRACCKILFCMLLVISIIALILLTSRQGAYKPFRTRRGARRRNVVENVADDDPSSTTDTPPPPSLSEDDLAALRAVIRAEHGVISNVIQYGIVTADTVVVAVQVGRNAKLLARLLAGLARVRDIESTLLVVSHSYYDDRINELVRNVRFCRAMQLFYSYSVQLYPDRFPGFDPRDCNLLNSTGDCTPRDARLVEHKQHWWWKANYIFSRIGGGVAERAPVVFLEEGHEVAPDLLYMLRHLQRAQAAFSTALLLALGCAPPASYTAPSSGLLQLAAWRPPYHVGLVLNRTAWYKISALAMHFCTYDDSSWSQSLLNVFAQLPAGHADMVACMWPRVVAGRAASRPPASWPSLFPQRVRVRHVWPATVHAPSDGPGVRLPAGGWSDTRDQLFCLDPLLDVDGAGSSDDYLGINDTLPT